MTHPGISSIDVAGEKLELLPQRAAFWSKRRTLVVADLHVGKAAAFRAAGVPIPIGSTAADLGRLTDLIQSTGAERLLILGDLYHAREGMVSETLDRLHAWRGVHRTLEVRIVRGNHDRRAGPSPTELDFHEAEEPLVERPFIFRHDPVESRDGYVLCGHLHPAAVMRGRGVRKVRLSCFCFGRTLGILPAFGTFTGTARIRPGSGERVFVIAGDEVLEAHP